MTRRQKTIRTLASAPIIADSPRKSLRTLPGIDAPMVSWVNSRLTSGIDIHVSGEAHTDIEGATVLSDADTISCMFAFLSYRGILPLGHTFIPIDPVGGGTDTSSIDTYGIRGQAWRFQSDDQTRATKKSIFTLYNIK